MQPINRPAVVIVGADKGGVGKTTTTLTLLDFFSERNISVRGVDSEYPQGILQRFAPDMVDVRDLTKSSHQMKVFDSIRDYSVTLIDIRAGLLSRTLDMLNQTGFFDTARQGKIQIVTMHILGDTEASYAEVAAVSDIIPDSRRILVKNHINPDMWEDGPDIVLRAGDELMDLPYLDSLAAKAIDKAGVTPRQFVSNASNSEVLRGYTRTWLRKVHEAYSRKQLDEMTK